MGVILTCKKCKITCHYHASEFENIGTQWHPVWCTKCNNCQDPISFEQKSTDLFDRPTPPNEKDAYQRAKESDIREYWVQEYIRENYNKLGFSAIEGPFDIGPDFKGIYKRRKTSIEVERDFQCYLKHKHFENETFKQVGILIVLNPEQPPVAVREKLPKEILYINVDDFVKWWRPKAKTYAKAKRLRTIISLIAGEFQRRYIASCSEKDRDMSTCPECDLCAYFGEGIFSEATPLFQDMTLKFISLYKYPITSEKFKLMDIEPSLIDNFYND